MAIRALAVAGLAALLGAPAHAAPRKHRTGTFANFIDPAVTDDPPRPWPTFPTWLAVVVLIDRSAPDLDAARAAAQQVDDHLENDDRVGILTFATTVDKVLRGGMVRDRKAFKRALETVSSAAGANVAKAIDEAREYVELAPDRRVIVLITPGWPVDERLAAALKALRARFIRLVVIGTPGADRRVLARIAEQAGGTSLVFDPDGDGERLQDLLAWLHWEW